MGGWDEVVGVCGVWKYWGCVVIFGIDDGMCGVGIRFC